VHPDAFDRFDARAQGVSRPIIVERAATRGERVDGMTARREATSKFKRRSLGAAA